MTMKAEPSGIKKTFGEVMEIAETVMISVFVIFLLFTYLFSPVKVDGTSMFPTLYDRDRLIMWSFGYEPQTGDIIIVNDDEAALFADASQTKVIRGDGLNKRIVKRCIACAGQTVDINTETGEVIVDGVVLDEPYISAPTFDDGDVFSFPITVPEGYVFALGDNRPGSTDSRFSPVGLIPEEQVLGHALFRFYRPSEDCAHWSDRFAVLVNK